MEQINKKCRGRPTKYHFKLAQLICEIVATHPWGLKRICKTYEDLPNAETIRLWKLNNKEFFGLYARAKTQQAELLAEDLLDIADDDSRDSFDEGSIARDRLKIDTRKWLASKLIPKVYGAKCLLEQKDEEEEKRVKEEIRQLRKSLDTQYKKDY